MMELSSDMSLEIWRVHREQDKWSSRAKSSDFCQESSIRNEKSPSCNWGSMKLFHIHLMSTSCRLSSNETRFGINMQGQVTLLYQPDIPWRCKHDRLWHWRKMVKHSFRGVVLWIHRIIVCTSILMDLLTKLVFYEILTNLWEMS